MQTQNRFLEDMARVASGAVGVASGLRGEVEARLREQFERILQSMDLVPRDEFDAVKAVAVRAREQQELLESRVTALEAELAALKPKKPAAAKRPARKSRAAKGTG